MKINRRVYAAALLMLAACTTPGPRERMAHRLALYTEAAGAPVDWIQYWQLHRWEPLGDAAVGVWTRPDRAYLITLRRPCFGLDYTPVIALTSSMHRIDRRFDTLRFENTWCHFDEIRPVDVKRLRALGELGLADPAAAAQRTPAPGGAGR